ncbi:transketolase [Alicyclobacillus sp. ALC3]|uniref:transketolase n=1 Tax=Alicyclobacillus sp. ALC3 TaxID=2796143 RepID=UPI002379E0F8|nr:transketolase [Alicyclobacillus sp. ALC3]WDL98255.1 transketolase [Alicyclobacillus sp. ALC3]
MPYTKIDELAVASIRTLSIDAIEKANSGHPGLPMGAAPMAYVLWSRFMNYSPSEPEWFNRDRFVLSAGHGSMLLYSLLHLTGYDVTIEDLKSFRQWGSKTPGHPEYGHTPGVDATAGPLGQGLAMAVGMAMAERFLAAKFNRPGHEVVDHHTYVIAGDGDLMEGITSEASSLAGHLGLNKLVVLYDSNDISLDGPTSWCFTENVADRYRAYGWNVLRVEDGNDMESIEAAIRAAKTETERPTLIEVKTVIGYGAPKKQGTKNAHGEPLGADEATAAKQAYQWAHEPFHVPAEVVKHFAELKQANEEKRAAWEHNLDAYAKAHADLAAQLDDAKNGRVRVDWDAVLPAFDGSVATRDAFSKVINAVAPHVPTLLGGSADLSGSNKTLLAGEDRFDKETPAGRNVFYGVREHAMGAMVNGIALHKGVFAYGGTFLVFCDYLRPALRMAALMKQPAIQVFTHDSIAVGEDGPTHEPVEQIASLRAIPGLTVLRPADATETAFAVRYALEHRGGPVALALTRQKLPVLPEVAGHGGDFARGGYVIYQHGAGDQLALLASGSEVQLALAAAKQLADEGVAVRVVSMPSLELFAAQDEKYRESVLPSAVTRRLAVEMGHPMPWYQFVGTGAHSRILGIDRFGASAPGDTVVREYGFTKENVIDIARDLL